MPQLKRKELTDLIKSVFPEIKNTDNLCLLVDIPGVRNDDNERWQERRLLAGEWYRLLAESTTELGLNSVKLAVYPDVGSNNADLPEYCWEISGNVPDLSGDLEKIGSRKSFLELFQTHQLFLAPTEYSTTAPLKNAARKFGFRAATMPGFIGAMIPALRIDYNEVFKRCAVLKKKLDEAESCSVSFLADREREFAMFFDLRFRKSHLSSGRFPESGTAGNLPSGETYIVPYEGEKQSGPGETALASRTAGSLPVEINGSLVVFDIRENRAVNVSGESPESENESAHLKAEPAYGNMAELGFGVLGDFGLKPINEILLDEKLGFHVAFGRSDHFGGAVGPGDFSTSAAVIHLDRIYIRDTQPRIEVVSLKLNYLDREPEEIIAGGNYLIF